MPGVEPLCRGTPQNGSCHDRAADAGPGAVLTQGYSIELCDARRAPVSTALGPTEPRTTAGTGTRRTGKPGPLASPPRAIMSRWPYCRVATCQFSVRADVGANLGAIERQLAVGEPGAGARVAHFPEGALSGYAGTEFESFAGFDWAELRAATAEVAEHARRLGIWVVLGLPTG